MGKKSLQSFRSYLHFWENGHVVCKFLKLRAVFRLKMPGLKGISLIGDCQWSKVVYKRVRREKPAWSQGVLGSVNPGLYREL